MARVATAAEASRVSGPPTLYPWHNWANGLTWVVTQGEDFQVSPYQFVVNCHGHALGRGMKVRTSIDGGSVIFRFYTAR